MKLTVAKCTCCPCRVSFARPTLNPRCPKCNGSMERTSRSSIGQWHVGGRCSPNYLDLHHATRELFPAAK